MKRPLSMHGTWALVTVLSFVTGSQWSPFLRMADLGAAEMNRADRQDSTPQSRRASGTGFDPGTWPAGNDAARAPSRRPPGPPGLAAARLNTERLTGERLDSLFRASIASGSPVARRLAFDRLLEEMGSTTFTLEQAAAIRKAMREHGASSERWKLFDYAWGASLPDAAIAFLGEVPEEHRNACLGNILPGLASENPQRAIALDESLAPELQGRIRPRLLEGLVDNDFVAATDYIYESTDPENYDCRPMDELARELVREKGLDSTLEWAAGLPEGSLRNSAWRAAYAAWTSQDPHAALQSISDLPASVDRNHAINGFISALAPQDGERAVQWGAEITEPGLRNAALIRVGRHYYAQDQEAAPAWFPKSGLPPAAWQQMTASR